MDDSLRELQEAAIDAASRSHSPYSRFAVGAAIRTASGRVVAGCNVENASYPEGWCAETSAIARMVSEGGPDERIADIVTVAPGGDDGSPATPCGGCRQRIREFATADTMIHATTAEGDVVSMTIDELIPASFGPERLV